MAATKLIAIHQNKGLTLEQTLGIRCDYIKNKDKTDDGRLVSSYSCNPDLVDEEFLLSKKEYQQNGCVEHEGDIIAYHIRQAFKPGEITPEEANRIGYETAMRFTKGNHAFIVATHTDKPHIHNHIVFNSTDLACKKKFRNFLFSGIALQRLSDIICLENGLYFVRGCTALLDAIGAAVHKEENVQSHLPEDHKAGKIIFVITTDGHENSSKEYSYTQVKNMIEAKKEMGWEFLFLGANIDAIGEAEKLGIDRNRAVTYENDREGVALNYEVVGRAVRRAVACESETEALFEDDWAEDIADYRKKKRADKNIKSL